MPEVFGLDAYAPEVIVALAMLLGAPVSLWDAGMNLLFVIAGNIVGGSVLVALVYWVIYLRRPG